MIRLSTAHAKMRMSKFIDIVDAAVATEIMRLVVEADGFADQRSALSAGNLLGKDPDGEQKVNDGSCARNESSMNISDFSALQKHFQAVMFNRDSIELKELYRQCDSLDHQGKFTRRDLETFMQQMQSENRIMIHEDVMHVI